MIDKVALAKFMEEQKGTSQEGLQALLREMTKEVIETVLEAEMSSHLGYSRSQQNGSKDGNARNGHNNKSVKSGFGEFDLSTPRDRLSTFDPQLVKKRQTDISGIEAKVISMYAKGMSTRDISGHIFDIYGFELSAESISAITDKVLSRAKEWQTRPLESVYAIVYLDGMVVKIKTDGVVKNRTVYVILGIDLCGNKSCLGLYIAESESSKYWLTVMNELKGRGLQDVLIFSVDNLSGISEAITTAFPQADIQKCIVHQIRSSLKFVPWKHYRAVTADLKPIYKAATEKQAKEELDVFAKKWDPLYPHITKSWRNNWAELSTFFKYAPSIRKLIYTTNPIESFHRSVRKVTKTRVVFPTEDSLVKLFYLAVEGVEKKWTQILREWGQIYAELTIFYPDRILKSV
jgi:transposase-like protein